MLTIRIVNLDGTEERLRVEQAEFLQTCHYSKCHVEFPTINPDRLHCSTSHKVMAYQERKFGTIAQARAFGVSTLAIA